MSQCLVQENRGPEAPSRSRSHRARSLGLAWRGPDSQARDMAAGTEQDPRAPLCGPGRPPWPHVENGAKRPTEQSHQAGGEKRATSTTPGF